VYIIIIMYCGRRCWSAKRERERGKGSCHVGSCLAKETSGQEIFPSV